MSVDVGTARGYLDLDISGFLRGLRTAQEEGDSASRNLATRIGGNLTTVGKSLTSAGGTLTKSITVPVVGAGTAIIKMTSDFESGMSKVQAISGASTKDFESLRDKALELGVTTAFSASEVANGMSEMAKAGWNSQQIIAGMEGVLNAASASGENLATVSTIVADAITGFGMEAKDATKIADLLTQAANSGTIDINDLGESFKYIAPVASSMGLSVEDVTTALSAMSMAGIKGSQAGTSLKNLLTNLVNPVGQAKDAIEELGISAINSDGSMKSMGDIVGELRTKFDGLTDSEKAQYAAMLAGKEGMSGLLSLLNLTEEEYGKIAESMNNANGVAKETADIMLNNLSGQVTILKSALEGLAIQLGDIILPYVKKFVAKIQEWVEKFSNLSKEEQTQIIKMALFAAAIGPTLVVIGKLISGIGGLTTAFGKISGGFKAVAAGGKAGVGMLAKFGGALAGITAPVIAVVAVIAVLTAAFINLWKNNEEFRDNITAIWNQIKDTFNNFTQGIVDRLNALGFNFESITDVIKAVWEGFCNFLAPIFEYAFQYIADVFSTITNVILGIVDFFIAVFKGDWEGAWNAIEGIFKSIWTGIKNWFSNILNAIKGILNVVCGWFGTTWSNTWNKIKTFFINVWNDIKLKASDAWNNIKTTASNVWDKIKSAITNPLDAAKNTISNIVNNIKNSISNGFNSAKNTVSSVFDSIKSKIQSVMDSAKSIVTGAIDKIKSAFNFSWSLPKLKLPHISITGSFSLSPPSVPKFGVEWYSKAMNNGMILDAATIFGFNSKTGKFLGGGEAGSETIVGTQSLLKMIKQAVYEAVGPLVKASYELAKASAELGYVTYNGFTKLKETKDKQDDNGKGRTGSGDTFIFNSPKHIDEIEAAKQMKKTKKELAEGF